MGSAFTGMSHINPLFQHRGGLTIFVCILQSFPVGSASAAAAGAASGGHLQITAHQNGQSQRYQRTNGIYRLMDGWMDAVTERTMHCTHVCVLVWMEWMSASRQRQQEDTINSLTDTLRRERSRCMLWTRTHRTNTHIRVGMYVILCVRRSVSAAEAPAASASTATATATAHRSPSSSSHQATPPSPPPSPAPPPTPPLFPSTVCSSRRIHHISGSIGSVRRGAPALSHPPHTKRPPPPPPAAAEAGTRATGTSKKREEDHAATAL